MSEASIGFDEWFEALRHAESASPDGLTSREICGALDCSLRTAREKIGQMIRENRATCVGRKRITSIDGRQMLTPVYRLTPVVKVGAKKKR